MAGNNSQNENTFLKKILLGYFLVIRYLLGFFILEKQLVSQDMFLVRSELSIAYYCISLSCIVLIYVLTITIVSQKYQDLSVQIEIGE